MVEVIERHIELSYIFVSDGHLSDSYSLQVKDLIQRGRGVMSLKKNRRTLSQVI